MKDNIILVDCDGVLLDWEPYFFHWAKEKHGLELKNPNVYNVGKALGITPAEGHRLIGVFNSSTNMANLGPLRDAVKYVRKLYSEHGFRFHVITSQTTDKAAQEFRKYNLETLFGKEVFEGFTILSQGADKDEALLKYKDTGCYWIEDKPENAEAGVKLGLDGILMEHNHNKDYLNINIKTTNNWKEIYNIITGEV
jgi:uncharacterized HAD superfamily protein